MEKSYVMIKPEFANHDWIIEEVTERIEKEGLTILASGFVKYDKTAARVHYSEHLEKGFYPELEEYIISDIAYGMIVEGENAIKRIRLVVNGPEKKPSVGSIRYDIPTRMGRELDITKNVIHASDKPESEMVEELVFKALLYKEVDSEN